MNKNFTNQKPITFFLIFAFAITFTGCMSTKSFQILKAASISIPTDVQTIVLVNRYKPSKENKWKNIVEGIFSGEMLGADKEGANNALMGLSDQILRSPRYKVVQANYTLEGTGTGAFPEPLTLAQIQKLCSDFGADAVVAIETFDSDLQIDVHMEDRKTVDENKKEIIKHVYVANEGVNLTMGWRVYGKKDARILDEYRMYHSNSFTHEAATELLAKQGLLFPVQAIKTTAANGGRAYSDRIAATYTYISRDYYGRRKGFPEMKNARSYVKTDDWAGAATIWKNMLNKNDLKVKGRAAYNLALASEATGDLESALVWARKSANDYQNRKAVARVQALNYRIEDKKRLDEQMKK